MCHGVWSYKIVLAHLWRKLNAWSTNWLIWIISLKQCLANISSRICQIRDRDTLNRDRQTKKFCWGWAAWATFFAGSRLRRVEAFFGPGAEPHLGHIWVIFQPGRWVTLGRFFDLGARSHKGDFSKTFSFWVMHHLLFLFFYHRNAPYKIKIIVKQKLVGSAGQIK
jgi:hypothetical protein